MFGRAERLGAASATAAVILLLIAATLVALSRSGPGDVTLRIGGGPYTPIPIEPGQNLCQPFAVVPSGTVAARYRVLPDSALPRITLIAPDGGLTRLSPLRRTNPTTAVTPIPAAIPRDRVGGWRLCARGAQPAGSGMLGLGGAPGLALTGPRLGSWLGALPTLTSRVSVGRARVLGGAALPVSLVLLGVAIALATLVLTRSRVALPVDRRTVVLVAGVALSLSSAFAVLTPPFQAPDEGAHQQYVEYLVANKAVPGTPTTERFGPELGAYMGGTGFAQAFQRKDGRPAWTAAEQQQLERALAMSRGRPVPNGWSTASSQPPLYYAAVATVSTIVGGDARDRLLIGRLLSALLVAFALVGAMVFARATVPSAGGLVAIGGLIVATNPLFAFLGGALNPDAALFAAASWAFAGLAVAWREGLTPWRALWIGVAIGAGLASKLTFLGLAAPMVIVCFILLAREVRRRGVRGTVAVGATGTASAALLGAPFYLWKTFRETPLVVDSPDAAEAAARAPDLLQWITYTAQLYVGRIPPMDDQFVGWGPDLFVSGLVGTLGWLDFGPPSDTWRYFRMVAGLLLLLAAIGIARAVRRHPKPALAQLAMWGAITAGLLLSVSWAGYNARLSGQPGFEQGRYLLPLIPIAVAGIALALRQVPGRVQRPIAVAFGIAGLAHGVLLYLMTIGRYFA